MPTRPASPQPAQPPRRPADLLRTAIDLLEQHLPPSWSLALRDDTPISETGCDALVELRGPGETNSLLGIQVKLSAPRRDILETSMRLPLRSGILQEMAGLVIVARYLSPPVRGWLEEHDISYIDATGNLRLALEQPPVLLRDRGSDRDPWRGPGRPRGTLKGPAAARVVRALVDFSPPYGVRELVRLSGASTGATYRVVEFLEDEDLLERTPSGPITAVRWRSLLQRWSEDFGFLDSNAVDPYLHPRGVSEVLRGLSHAPDLHYAVTGSFAAQCLAPYAPPRLATIYADHPEQIASRLHLRKVDTNGNVLLAASNYDVVFDRLTEVDGVRFTAPSQTAVDLLTSPGRSPSEAQALMDWMEAHEPEWRR